MQRWQRVDKLADGMVATILTRHQDRNTIEVRRESRCIHGPRVIDDTTALHCVDRYGFKEVEKPKRGYRKRTA